MNSPYFNTQLYADIRLKPHQMNNNILDELKQNLNKELTHKCYNNYGYIDAIYDIDDNIEGGNIRPEDKTSSSLYKLKFSCRIVNPIIKGTVIAKITGINDKMILARDGPIVIIIGMKNINSNNIVYHKTSYYPLKDGKIINKPIVKDSYVIMKINNKKIINGSSDIIAIGSMENVASNDEVKEYMKKKYPDVDTDISDIMNKKIDEELTELTEEVSESEEESEEESDGELSDLSDVSE